MNIKTQTGKLHLPVSLLFSVKRPGEEPGETLELPVPTGATGEPKRDFNKDM